MRRQLGWLCILPVLAALTPAPSAAAGVTTASGPPDYPGATWIPADPSNFSWGIPPRPHGYTIDMIVIHDIEGSYAAGIQDFQTPNWEGSAHYVVGYQGEIAQMVRERDIAWHAGNWDYNSRAIGIEHAGFAGYDYYTSAEYTASAALAASICMRYGVPLDRAHVIGHSEVPDPNNPGLFGGQDHHTDPGPTWDWPGYMSLAQADARLLPSPPHMMPDPVATNGLTNATVSWQPARTCRAADRPITGYAVTSTPATVTMSLPATATSATFNNLQPGTSYTFTVTATNADGSDSLTSNAVIPGHCNLVHLSAAPGSPQPYGTSVQLSGTSVGCPNPLYAFWTLAPGSSTWTNGQAYSTTSTFSWNTTGHPAGNFQLMLLARDANSAGTHSGTLGAYDDSNDITYAVTPTPCSSVTLTASPLPPTLSGTPVVFTASASGCASPQYEFVMRPATQGDWQLVQGYGATATYKWNSTGAEAGIVYFGVHARDATIGAPFDALTSIPYAVTTPSCASVAASAAPITVFSGNHVTITAAATGCTNSPRYEFWMRPANVLTWQLVQGYGTSNTYDWNSTGAALGPVYLGVHVKDVNSLAGADAYASTGVSVITSSCASATLTAAPTTVVHSTSNGTHVTVTVAASGCTTSPRSEFWIRPAGSTTWVLVQGYGTSATYDWNSTGAEAGTVYLGVHVRDANSTASADAYASTPVAVT